MSIRVSLPCWQESNTSWCERVRLDCILWPFPMPGDTRTRSCFMHSIMGVHASFPAQLVPPPPPNNNNSNNRSNQHHNRSNKSNNIFPLSRCVCVCLCVCVRASVRVALPKHAKHVCFFCFISPKRPDVLFSCQTSTKLGHSTSLTAFLCYNLFIFRSAELLWCPR